MCDFISNKQLTIKSYMDIKRYYRQVHKKYRSSEMKPDTSLREWMCLLSFLKKNKFRKCKIINIHYPILIIKGERPDFLLKMKDLKLVNLEIIKVTSRNLEALFTLMYKYGFDSFEVDPRLYNDDVKLSKKELMSFVRKTHDELIGNPMLGNYKEHKWAELCFKAVKKKNAMNYLIDILLLDDQHINSSNLKSIEIGLHRFSELVEKEKLQLSIIKNVISENQSGIIQIFDNGLWKLEYKRE